MSIFDDIIGDLKGTIDWLIKGRPDDAPFTYAETRVGRTPVIIQERPDYTAKGWGGAYDRRVKPLDALQEAIRREGPSASGKAGLYLQLGKILREKQQYEESVGRQVGGSILVNTSPYTSIEQREQWGPVIRHEDIHAVTSGSAIPKLWPADEETMRGVLSKDIYGNASPEDIAREALAYGAQQRTPPGILGVAKMGLSEDVREKVDRLAPSYFQYEKADLTPVSARRIGSTLSSEMQKFR